MAANHYEWTPDPPAEEGRYELWWVWLNYRGVYDVVRHPQNGNLWLYSVEWQRWSNTLPTEPDPAEVLYRRLPGPSAPNED